MNRIIITPNDFGGVDEVICKWFKCPNCRARLRWKLHQKPIK